MRQFESEEQVVATEIHSNVGQLIQKLTENKVEIRGCNKTKEAAKETEINGVEVL